MSIDRKLKRDLLISLVLTLLILIIMTAGDFDNEKILISLLTSPFIFCGIFIILNIIKLLAEKYNISPRIENGRFRLYSSGKVMGIPLSPPELRRKRLGIFLAVIFFVFCLLFLCYFYLSGEFNANEITLNNAYNLKVDNRVRVAGEGLEILATYDLPSDWCRGTTSEINYYGEVQGCGPIHWIALTNVPPSIYVYKPDKVESFSAEPGVYPVWDYKIKVFWVNYKWYDYFYFWRSREGKEANSVTMRIYK